MTRKDFLRSRFPLAFAHRGGVQHFPENSLNAFKGAQQMGYEYMETDVHVTKDGKVIAFHDHKLDRVTDQSGNISDLKYSDLSIARIDGQEPIPLLEELLEELPESKFNIDPKHDAAVQPLAKVISKMNCINRICIGSFSDTRITELHRLIGPELCTGMGPKSISKLQMSKFSKKFFRTPFGDCAQVPSKIKGVSFITKDFVNRAHEHGKVVHAWTINDANEMEYLLDIGVDGIMTDNLEVLKSVYLSRGIWDEGN